MGQDIELTNEQLVLFRTAFLKSYSDFGEIRRDVRYELAEALDDISRNIALGPGVDALIEWAEDHGRVGDLAELLRKKRERNPHVQRFLASLQFSLPAKDFEETHIPRAWDPKRSGLEALVLKPNPIQVAVDWRAEMAKCESRVCRLETGGAPVGTGFLVAQDLVLTNCHVYRPMEGKESIARFDSGGAGGAGLIRQVQTAQPLAVSTEDRLDFALLRLREPVEDERGWLRPKRHDFPLHEVQLILQHASGGPLQLGIGQVLTYLTNPAPRVSYNTNTENGSSGSPVFTINWQLVAIHHWGSAQNNSGIPLGPIWDLLSQKGLV